MRTFHPMAWLMLGTLLAGGGFTLAEWFMLPEAQSPREILSAFSVGTVLGLVCLTPMTLAALYREQLLRILEPHWFHVQFYISTSMAFGLGYLLASTRLKGFDGYTMAAIVVVFVGAILKTAMCVLVGRGQRAE